MQDLPCMVCLSSLAIQVHRAEETTEPLEDVGTHSYWQYLRIKVDESEDHQDIFQMMRKD